jgi:hypothetical protein
VFDLTAMTFRNMRFSFWRLGGRGIKDTQAMIPGLLRVKKSRVQYFFFNIIR